MAGLADYQVQVNEDAQRDSFTFVEESGATDSTVIERDENHLESGNETAQRLQEKDTQIEELRNLNKKLRSLNEQLNLELNLADTRIDEMERLIEKLNDDLILGTKTVHK